jgi:hypothetical protein
LAIILFLNATASPSPFRVPCNRLAAQNLIDRKFTNVQNKKSQHKHVQCSLASPFPEKFHPDTLTGTPIRQGQYSFIYYSIMTNSVYTKDSRINKINKLIPESCTPAKRR